MVSATNKKIVQRQFCKNFATYNNEAVVQYQIASKLARLLMINRKIHYNRVLEIGCGTGFLTQEILNKFSVGEYILNDLVESVYSEIRQIISAYDYCKCKFIHGDAESINLPINIDAVISSSSFQWFNNIDLFISKMNKLLKSAGILAFSTFGEDNFKEIKTILDVGLDYNSLSELKRIVSKDFEIIHAEEWIQKEHFINPKAVLKHMKLTGVNGLNKDFFGKETYRMFNDKYKQLYSNKNKSVNLTYHPIIIIAKKK